MSRFLFCLKHVLKEEGGYVNHPADKGGATNMGVTQAVYDNYHLQKGLGRQPVSGISGEEVADIYEKKYWVPSMCDLLAPPIDHVVFDSAVNHGIRQAALFLQRAAGVAADGRIGPVTLNALSKSAPGAIAASIIEQREDFYHMLVEKNPRQSVFLKGWLNRLKRLRETAGIA